MRTSCEEALGYPADGQLSIQIRSNCNTNLSLELLEPAVEGALRTRGFFDDEGNALPVMTVFDNASGN